MRINTFILFVVLLTVITFLATFEQIETMRAKKQIAVLFRKKDKVEERIETQEVELSKLASPQRLDRLNRELKLGLRPRPVIQPQNIVPAVEVRP